MDSITAAPAEQVAKLEALGNERVTAFVTEMIELCKPEELFVVTDDAADIAHVRQMAIDKGEESKLAIEGHTIHFDGPQDQGRDKANTKYLIPEGVNLGRSLNSVEREEGLKEVKGYMAGSMAGKTMIVRFMCLGPVDSVFAIPCIQVTDSWYVAHSETQLYRAGYAELKRQGADATIFRFAHTAGELDGAVSKNVDKRRVYIDIEDEMVYSTNTQYAGNTVGLKKLALRLSIRKAAREGWLAEHMFIMGVNGPGGRKTYMTGAYPSACGKTSTAMLPGETIVGDDIAFLRKNDGKLYAANTECGIFGIIADVNKQDDPLIYELLTTPGEVIFSNVLRLDDNTPRWLGDGREAPTSGTNYVGDWTSDNEANYAHKNARYTIKLKELANCDEALDDGNGVPVGGVIYGGRDSDTNVPVMESFDWAHGVVTMGASLESETTAATLGAEGVRNASPMANADFLAIPLGEYIGSHLKFTDDIPAPKIFGTNYFQKTQDGKYLTGMADKRVWVKWMELRIHGDVDAIDTPCGKMPKFEDLAKLFKEVLDVDYTRAQYDEQFTVRVNENLAKLDRTEKMYKEDSTTPEKLFEVINEQRARLTEAKEANGELIAPAVFGA